MNFDLHPPQAAGPLRIGATGHDTVEILRQLGTLRLLCRTHGRRPGWGVDRPSGLFISTLFDADDHLEAIQFGRPDSTDDTVTYDGLDVFTTPAANLMGSPCIRRTGSRTAPAGPPDAYVRDGDSYVRLRAAAARSAPTASPRPPTAYVHSSSRLPRTSYPAGTNEN